MLPSFRKRLTVALCADHIAVLRTTRGWRPRAGQPALLGAQCAVGAAAWQAPLAALRDYLGEDDHAGTDLEVIVSDSFANYALIPWSDEIKNRQELLALTHIHLDTLFGPLVAAGEIQVDMGDYAKAGIACALEREFMRELESVCVAHRMRLVSLQANFMRSFNRNRMRIGANVVYGVVDAGICVLSSRRDGGWNSIRSVRLREDSATELQVLIDREILLQGMAADTAVCLDVLSKMNTATFNDQEKVHLCMPSAAGRPASKMLLRAVI